MNKKFDKRGEELGILMSLIQKLFKKQIMGVKMKKEVVYKISRKEVIESIMKQENITGKVTMSKLSSDGLKLWVKEDE